MVSFHSFFFFADRVLGLGSLTLICTWLADAARVSPVRSFVYLNQSILRSITGRYDEIESHHQDSDAGIWTESWAMGTKHKTGRVKWYGVHPEGLCFTEDLSLVPGLVPGAASQSRFSKLGV